MSSKKRRYRICCSLGASRRNPCEAAARDSAGSKRSSSRPREFVLDQRSRLQPAVAEAVLSSD
jgi:hypothetical protein